MFPVFSRKVCWISLVVVVLILVVPSLQYAAAESKSQANRSTASRLASVRNFEPASLEPMPTVDFHLYFNDSLLGETWIDAQLTMNVEEGYNRSTGKLLGYMIGYTFDYIAAFNPLLAPGLLGIGVDWFLYYPYFYNSSGKVYDYWERGQFEEAGRREWPFWDTTGGEGGYLGYVKPSEMGNGSRYGEYMWLHDIRLYFQGNVSVLCSPNSLLLWADFQWDGTNWTISSQIWDSMYKHTVVGSQAADLNVVYPLDPAKTIIIIAVPSIVALISFRKRDALRARFHRKSSIELEGSEYCYH